MPSERRVINVTASWDPEAEVWTALSDDLPGLVSESASFDGLIQRVSAIIPELLPAAPIEVDRDAAMESVEIVPVHVIFRADRQVVVAA